MSQRIQLRGLVAHTYNDRLIRPVFHQHLESIYSVSCHLRGCNRPLESTLVRGRLKSPLVPLISFMQ